MLNKSQSEIVKKSSYRDLVIHNPEIFYLLKKHILLKQYGFHSPPKIPRKIWTPQRIKVYSAFCSNQNQFRTLFFDAYVIAQKTNLLNKLNFNIPIKPAPKKTKKIIVEPEVIKDSLGEQLVRKAFEYHFKVAFPKLKPKWLVNPKTNSRMELDGFNKKLRIAFEVNGVHHFQKKFTQHSDVKFKDNLKKTICKQRGIHLLTIKFISLPQLITLLNQELNVSIAWLSNTVVNLNGQEHKINCKVKNIKVIKKMRQR